MNTLQLSPKPATGSSVAPDEPFVCEYKGRRLTRGIAPNGAPMIHYFHGEEDGRPVEYGMCGEEHLAIRLLKRDIDMMDERPDELVGELTPEEAAEHRALGYGIGSRMPDAERQKRHQAVETAMLTRLGLKKSHPNEYRVDGNKLFRTQP